MSGLIGQICRRELGESYGLSALNRRPVEGLPCLQADIADLDAIRPAFEGVETVVHLAAMAQGDPTWEDVLPHNIIGTYNVFEAARSAGVERVIFASSGAAVIEWERHAPYDALVEGRYGEVTNWDLVDTSLIRANGLYGCSKQFGETLARFFSDRWGQSMICLRIGRVHWNDRPNEVRDYSVWCSHADIAQLIRRCIDAPEDLKFGIYYVVLIRKPVSYWGIRSKEAFSSPGFVMVVW